MGHVGIMWRGTRSLLARYRMAKINLTLAPERGSRNFRREAKVARVFPPLGSAPCLVGVIAGLADADWLPKVRSRRRVLWTRLGIRNGQGTRQRARLMVSSAICPAWSSSASFPRP